MMPLPGGAAKYFDFFSVHAVGPLLWFVSCVICKRFFHHHEMRRLTLDLESRPHLCFVWVSLFFFFSLFAATASASCKISFSGKVMIFVFLDASATSDLGCTEE